MKIMQSSNGNWGKLFSLSSINTPRRRLSHDRESIRDPYLRQSANNGVTEEALSIPVAVAVAATERVAGVEKNFYGKSLARQTVPQ